MPVNLKQNQQNAQEVYSELYKILQNRDFVQYKSKMRRQGNLPEFQSVNRITNLPIVETGWTYAEYMYQRLKNSNNLVHWTLDQAESSLYNMIDTASPAVFLLEGPLSTIDKLLCKSLDMVEDKVPSINLPPQMIYSNTKEYVSAVGNKIVRPVLKRADSVKQIGNQVLASKYTTFAADKLDGALDMADMYVDKYLPADALDKGDEDESYSKAVSGPGGKAIQTSQHVYRFSRKVQRRLTRRTLLEAKALKEQSAEAIHVLVYVAELITTDPKLALQKGCELWETLSKDEPENQARPENLEQLIVLLTRETARRVVHLINFTAAGIGNVPQRVAQLMHAMTNCCYQLLDTLLKTVRVEDIGSLLRFEAETSSAFLVHVLKQLNVRISRLLEQMASLLSSLERKESSCPVPEKPSSSLQPTLPLPSVSVAEPAPKMEEPEDEACMDNELNAALNQANALNASKQPDMLQPPPADKPQLKATHRNASNAIIVAPAPIPNGESVQNS